MNDWGGPVGRDRIAELALWTGAGLIVLSTHVGTAAWLLRERPIEPADNMPPPAIMVDLAPEPEAVLTEENEISPDQEAAQESSPAEVVEMPEEEPIEEVVETEPEAGPIEEIADDESPVEREIAELDAAEVPIPVARPKPLEKKREIVKKEEPKRRPRQQPSTASKSAVQAQAQVSRSNRNAARQSSSGLFSSSVTPAKWQSRLMAHLERRKRYPSSARSRGEQGTAYVRFGIDDAGNVLSATLARSSGYPELDAEVLSLVRRASPVPAPPPGVSKTITAPVRFSVR
ncbi:energy transducer TonB [Aquamicrobium sp. LC103]|uniref:TonB family protein n=1 Tax=Aquamicrobium sp. LC103 TaxID=1120658 RepID=UPI00063E7C64|nr:energy transducer TonB [Aquamicrobium sp. LC103]TKT76184.1 energy transducer TonB [Aquamicrobium sp. LC103]